MNERELAVYRLLDANSRAIRDYFGGYWDAEAPDVTRWNQTMQLFRQRMLLVLELEGPLSDDALRQAFWLDIIDFFSVHYHLALEGLDDRKLIRHEDNMWRLPPRLAPPLKPAERFAILRRDGYQCRLCGVQAHTGSDVTLHVDHITPRNKGGTNDPMNLWTLCLLCNIGKSTRDL